MDKSASSVSAASSSFIKPHNLLTLLLLLSTSGCIYVATICIYRLFLHPFAHVPGPLLARLTDVYGLYHAWLQDTHLAIHRLHLQYGPIVRYGPDRILVNDVYGMKEIYGYNANFAKGKVYEALRFNPVHSVFNATDKNMHRRKRRLVAQGFSEAALRASEGCILKHVDRFVDGLLSEDTVSTKDGNWVTPKDLSVHANYLALDIITDLVFGQSTDALVKPDNRQYRPMLVSTGYRMGMANQMPEAFRTGKSGQWLDLGTWTLSNMDNQRAQWAGLLRGWAMERIETEKTRIQEPERRDMMSTIINATDPDTGEKLSTQEIVAEAFTLITAGSDTTATAISATLFYLSRNPSTCERVVAEIRSRFSSLEDVHMGPILNGCQYLRACIEEALRMSAPVITPLYREAGPGGAIVCGIYVPEGYVAASEAYALHHNEKYYPDSFSYLPERWMPSYKSEKGSISVSSEAKTAFFTFSHGTRNCAGINLAYLEISLALARLLWLADLRIPSQPKLARIGGGDRGDKEPMRRRENEYQLYDVFASEKEGPLLEFRRR
ncbi:hypothetical protein UA08_08508 [Talaromyces atroroseus]|uniref:Isotrichodermin C-15 hydroxylase n=1 Tax=Talaromyces atroroseus TaxID=1441469 RepID=A0A1Q5Q7Y9_TALAT|nr:hypothetical protein UA08_08508 [Talaromyces atroroseus]OKL56264.1 hypothetical protein UA08_08508 [Talaromyces atroroseus]